MATGDTLFFTPLANQPPSTLFATLDTRNLHPILAFDAATAWDAVFGGVLAGNYAGGGLTVTIHWTAASATSGDVKWNAAIERMDTGTDLDADSFASVQTTTTTTSATSGAIVTTSITFTNGAQMDSLAAGEAFRLKITRDAAAGGDTMTGNAEIHRVVVREN